jgi:hypothetical protein
MIDTSKDTKIMFRDFGSNPFPRRSAQLSWSMERQGLTSIHLLQTDAVSFRRVLSPSARQSRALDLVGNPAIPIHCP